VFGAEARQLFCERFHVAVKVPHKNGTNRRFSGTAGLPPDARSLSRVRFHTRLSAQTHVVQPAHDASRMLPRDRRLSPICRVCLS